MPKPINWADPVIMQERIVGGNEAAPHSWPWTVHIVTGFHSDFSTSIWPKELYYLCLQII